MAGFGMSRRSALRVGTGMLAAFGAAACGESRSGPPTPSADAGVDRGAATVRYRMPEEGQRHERTFMCLPVRTEVWGRDLPDVQAEILAVAEAIGQFEPVVLCADRDAATRLRRRLPDQVTVAEIPTDDLWARDTGPTFVVGPDGLAGVDLNFNGWGGKQTPREADMALARRVLAEFDIPRVRTWVVGEGGCLEVDGTGTLLATESSLVNDNRNPGRSRQDIEDELSGLLGLDRVIWFAGVRGQDITDAHVDSLARFAGPATVVLSRPSPATGLDDFGRSWQQAKRVLGESTGPDGAPYTVVDLPEADLDVIGADEDFLASYVNYYVCNGGVIIPRFGDRRADARAAEIIGELYPDRELRQVDISAIASGGGGIHCATQQQPAV